MQIQCNSQNNKLRNGYKTRNFKTKEFLLLNLLIIIKPECVGFVNQNITTKCNDYFIMKYNILIGGFNYRTCELRAL